MSDENHTLTAVPGLRVGHETDADGATGCTVVLCPPGTVGGVDQRGGAPGTRETDLLRPAHLVEHVNAVMLAGGSAYGLAAADGVMRYCEENGIGHPVEDQVVPIVPAAILMDLLTGRGDARPDAAMGYAAAMAAGDAPVAAGSVGAGTGCRVGAMMGSALATKGGIGSASVDLGDGLIVAAMVAVNAFGDVIGPDGAVMAGLRNPDGSQSFMPTMQAIRAMAGMSVRGGASNTVIGVVATSGTLTKEEANKVAAMAQNGVARAIRPAHTMFDGDTLFALATGAVPANVSVVGAYAAEVVQQAIYDAIQQATTLAGVRRYDEW